MVELSGCRGRILPDNSGVAGGNTEEGEAGPFGAAAALLPALQSADADAEGGGELLLGEPDEGSQVGDVLTRLNVTGHQAFALRPSEGSLEILLGQLPDVVAHLLSLPLSGLQGGAS